MASKRRRPPARHESQQPAQRRYQVTAQQTQFSGPLPPPQTLAEFETLVPGLAGKIVETMQMQSEHRMSLERRVVDANILSERIGQVFSLIIAFAALASGTWLIHDGKGTYGIVILVGDGAAIAIAFLRGQSAQGLQLRKQLNPFRETGKGQS